MKQNMKHLYLTIFLHSPRKWQSIGWMVAPVCMCMDGWLILCIIDMAHNRLKWVASGRKRLTSGQKQFMGGKNESAKSQVKMDKSVQKRVRDKMSGNRQNRQWGLLPLGHPRVPIEDPLMGLTHENSKDWSIHGHDDSHMTLFSKALISEQKHGL